MYSLIGSLVIIRDREAVAPMGMFTCASQFKYMQFRCQTGLHVHVLHPSSATRSLILDVSTCSMVCRRHEDPTNGPTGDPSMVRLP